MIIVDSSSSPNSPPNHIIDSYNKIESFLQNKSELLELWSSNHCQNTAFDHGGAVDGISNMDIVCRGEAPIYDPNFRQRGLNGDIVSNFRQLYDCGLAVKSTFDNHLNKIAKTLHMKSYSWDGYSNEIDDVGLIICPIKPSERATQKIQEKFQKIEPGPPESWLYDLVRASFVCNSENQIAEVCEALQRNFTSIFEVVQIFNHFITPYPSGYRNIVMNIRVKIKNKQGHVINFICEVVIHHVILRKYYVRQRVSEGCYFLSSILLTEERLGHANLVRNDHVFNMLDKLIVEVNHIKLESSQQKSKGSKDLPPSWKEDNIILQCLVALAEVRYQDLQNAPPLFTRKSPPPNSNSPLPPQQTEDYDEEESLIRSWVDILNFFHEYDWAEKYQRLLLIRHLVPKYSEDHAEVAEALDQLASILNHEGKHSMSIQLYEKSIYVKTRIFGERHGLVANTLYTMAEVMTGQGKYAMALPLHEQVGCSVHQRLFTFIRFLSFADRSMGIIMRL